MSSILISLRSLFQDSDEEETSFTGNLEDLEMDDEDEYVLNARLYLSPI
jgi:hypothetical protein